MLRRSHGGSTASMKGHPGVRSEIENGTPDGSDTEHPTDQIRIGAQVVEARDVARLERRSLLVAQVVTHELVVGELVLHRVLTGQRGQDLVEGVRGPDHGCTHTVAQPVIHSGTGSYARTSPFQPGTAPSSAIQSGS